jgi:hypothetical protein
MKRSILIALAVATVPLAHGQQIVYQNITGMTIASYRMASGSNSSLEFGDEVSLAGTLRQISQVKTIMQVQTTGLGTYDFDMTMRFRQLDGPAGAPGTVLGTPITYQIRALAEGAWNFTLPVATPVTVPNSLAVTFQLARVGGNTGGVGFQFNAANPPAVGNSDPTFFWRENTAGGTWGKYNFSGTNANLALELTAVPEPASMLALGLGAAAMLRRRRKA